jgi:hypothetical protein
MIFWEDHWNGAIHKTRFHELFSFSKKRFITLHQVKNSNLPDLFFQPLSEQTFDQFDQIHDILLSTGTSDNDGR